MKRYLKLLSLLLLCSVITSVQAQQLTLGVTGNIGFSKMATKNPAWVYDFKVKYTPSGYLGLFHEIQFNQSSSIGIELLLVQLEGKEVAENLPGAFLGTNSAGVLEEIEDLVLTNKLHASYLGLPMYYRHAIGKIGIKGGLQQVFFLYASSLYEENGEYNKDDPFHRENKAKDVKLHKIDFGPKIGVDYQLNKSFRLRADYYYGLTNIIPGPKIFPGEWPAFRIEDRRNRQITLGIQYVFYSE